MPETLDIRMAVPAEVDRLAELARRTFIATFAEHNTPHDMALYVDKAFSRNQLLAELEDSACLLLVSVKTDAIDEGVFLTPDGGVPLAFLPLPYSLEEDSEA